MSRVPHTFHRALALIFALICTFPATRATAAESHTVSDVETVVAAYLVNFLRYVEWPETAVPREGEPWRIGVLNAPGERGPLESMAEGKTVRGRSIAIVIATDPAELRNCQIVLLPASPANTTTVMNTFTGRPVLTVVYREKEPASVAAAIELVLQGRNIRYRLNAGVLAAQGLKPTAGLLENALAPATNGAARSP